MCFQEPIAAAIAHGLGNVDEEEPAILVVDIGGGTCDVSLLHSFEGILEVNAYDGDSCLGGVDLDFFIMKWWINKGLLPSGMRRYAWSGHVPQCICVKLCCCQM